jgi:uncharacterized membrane protein YphA (DoxX/SURF4 family)
VIALAWVGRWFFASAMVVLGIQNLVYKGLVKGLQVTPEWLPAHTFFAYLMGAVLIAGGVSVAVNLKPHWGADALALLFLASLLLLRLPLLGEAMHNISERTVLFETIVCACGACLLGNRGIPIARVLIGISMIVFGIDHLEIPAAIAKLIPSWMPGKLFLAWFTGIALIAAGVCIVIPWWKRLAASLLGLMFFLWVALLHAPRVAAHPHRPNEWNSLFVAVAMCGVAWILTKKVAR